MVGIRLVTLVLGGTVGLAACAKGSSFESHSIPGAGGGGGGSGGDGSGDTASSHAAGGAGGSTSGAGGAGAGGGQGSSTGSSSGGSSGSGASDCDYTAPNTCLTAETLSAVDGDQHSDTRTAKGTTSRWLKVLVSEAVSSFTSFPKLSYKATLVTPPGMDFDLFEYDGTISTPSCSGNPKHASGSPEAVTSTWGDTLGVDDTRWITLEVRYISGETCPSDPWTLTVKGHTNP